MSKLWGAAPGDWTHFDLILGLTEDLLPVVSNPNARIAAASTLKGLGKTPSMYNGDGLVVGLAKWSQRKTSERDVARWSAHPDYGICLQTRRVRAFDIDVPDVEKADAIEAAIGEVLGFAPPARRRSNSGKRLLAVICEGELFKRVAKVDGGIVELLATGQQFIAVATHESGVRYAWDDDELPDSFPEISVEQYEAVWQMLVERFAVEDPKQVGRGRRRGKDSDIADDVVEYLEANHVTHGFGNDGQIFIDCPFAAEHTGDTGHTSTAYFPAGTGGYERGHFACLHAHCAGRADDDFLDAVGYRAAEFETLPAVVGAGGIRPDEQRPGVDFRLLPLPGFVRDGKGAIEPLADNVQKALQHVGMAEARLGFDTFRDELMVDWTPMADGWETFADEDYFELRIRLERRSFKPVGRELIRDAVHYVARVNRFDTAQMWLNSLEWDGVPRVARFFADYIGTADDEYATEISCYTWSALAGRVLQPGVQADMAPVLYGPQGCRKTSGIKAIAPFPEAYGAMNLANRDADTARLMRGTLVVELEELRGLQGRDAEDVKAFVTRTHEQWIPKYKEMATTFPRRHIFIGSTNKPEFLDDETGNRRWLPATILPGRKVDVDAIVRDRLQLWAEGAAMFRERGVQWARAEQLALAVHANHRITDSWEDVVEAWLDEPELGGSTPRSKGYLLLADVAIQALGFQAKALRRPDELRLAKVLRTLGYEKRDRRMGGKIGKVWEPVGAKVAENAD